MNHTKQYAKRTFQESISKKVLKPPNYPHTKWVTMNYLLKFDLGDYVVPLLHALISSVNKSRSSSLNFLDKFVDTVSDFEAV